MPTLAEENQIFVLKTDNPNDNDYWKPRIDQSLRGGFARFGWGLRETGDLRALAQKAERGGRKGLTDKEMDALDAKFLLRIRAGDYLIYLNLPSFGECSLVRATGSYEWREWDKDYNHGVPVETVQYRFSRNDRVIHPELSRRLKLMGRYWTIKPDSREHFKKLLGHLEMGPLSGTAATASDRRDLLENDIDGLLDQITTQMRRTHPEKKLEELLVSVLAEMPSVEHVERRSGSKDVGADIVFEYYSGPPFSQLQRIERCGVQVKCYSGQLDFQKAIEDLRRAFELEPGLSCGLIVSTALEMTSLFEEALERLRQETGKPVGVLIGKELAAWFIKHGLEGEK